MGRHSTGVDTGVMEKRIALAGAQLLKLNVNADDRDVLDQTKKSGVELLNVFGRGKTICTERRSFGRFVDVTIQSAPPWQR
jgi:hypothetical protein